MLSMSSAVKRPAHGHRIRRRKFIDWQLQGWLLLGLVLLETLMLVAGVAYLHVQFSAAVDASLYRIHPQPGDSLLPLFVKELAWVVVVMGGVNTLALLVANQLWVGHVRRVQSAFRRRLERLKALDLRQPQSDSAEADHEVIELLEDWRARESERARTLEQLLTRLDSGDEGSRSRALVALDKVLQEVR